MEHDDLDLLLLGAIGGAAAELSDELNRSRLTTGQRLSHYRIIEPIGEGGMGLVYKAEDEKLQRLVALKVLQPGPGVDGALRSRLEHEARAASALDHPSICTVHDFDEDGPHRFIVMEYLTGQTLKERATTAIPEPEAIRIALAVASALKAAHQRRIIHCDIKPANIFLTQRGEVKVLDFGIAKLQSAEGSSRPPSSSSAAGTRAYMSPEQARGDDLDERADIYSLGAVLREIVRSPSRPLQRVIARMVEEDRSRRFANMQEVKAALGAAQTRSSRRPWLVTAAVAVIAAGAWLWLQPPPAVLAERDWILIGEFENRTADPAFTDVLGDVVSVQIGQSPYLIVFPEARIAEQLELMRRPRDQRLTADIAREICERAGIKAYVTGSVASLGSRFVVRLDVLNARTGDYLAREEGDADDPAGVLRAIGRASAAVRRALGESYQSVQRFDVPADTATTGSLEALRAFRLGQEQLRLGTAAAMKAVPFFKRAIELDPEFSMAYARLGVAYANARESKRSEEAAREAFVRRARVSERERYEIETRYYDNVSGEVSKAIESVEMWAKAYPGDPRPFNTLSAYFKNSGQLERAAETGETALQLLPTSTIYRSNLVGAYFRLSQFTRAAQVSQDAIRDGLDNSTTHRFLHLIASLTGDAALAAREEAWRSKRTSDYANLEYQASMAGAGGRVGEARRLYRQAISLAERQGLMDRAAEYRMRWAQLELLVGNDREAVQLTGPLLTGEAGRLLQADAAFVLAAAGDAKYAAVADRLAREYPEDEYLRRLWQPLSRAAADLRAGNPAPVVEPLHLLEGYDRGDHAALRPSYYLGQAQLALAAAPEARRSFQKIIDNRGVVATSALWALAHLGVARATARDTNPGAAREAYDRFFTLWKDADPGLPILKSARREYARLAAPAAP
jgi:Flp pilus assembly protein TadD